MVRSWARGGEHLDRRGTNHITGHREATDCCSTPESNRLLARFHDLAGARRSLLVLHGKGLNVGACRKEILRKKILVVLHQ